jgi:ParB family transcriptional regulator, chromosome partitioning protein
MPLQLDDLAALDAPSPTSMGQPLLLPLIDIDEDPDQPRREFDVNALQELAETIRERGVRQPISVRPNLQQAGRWVLNFGARRLRASKLAGLEAIPAFVDTTADSYDQVIENEQREGLKPLELALFVQKRLAAGDNQAEIARRMGKSRQYVTFATALIDAPDWLLGLYRQGCCKGMAELYELRRLHGEHPEAIEAWCLGHKPVTRSDVADLRAKISGDKCTLSEDETTVRLKRPDAEGPIASSKAAASTQRLSARVAQQRSMHLHVEMCGEHYRLVLSEAPQTEGQLYVQPLPGGQRRQVPAASLRLIGFVS